MKPIIEQNTVNGVTKPLHEISVETLLSIREASKPKPVPAIAIGTAFGMTRLIVKVPMSVRGGEFLVVDGKGRWQNSGNENMVRISYNNIRELKLDEV